MLVGMRPDGLSDEISFPKEPLRERFPRYLKTYGVLIVASVAIGSLFGLLTDAGVVRGVGGTLAFVGLGAVGAGGFFGGGYDSIGRGTTGFLFGGRSEVRPEDEGTHLADRLREGLRPEANPTAFWAVIGGFGLIAAGIGILSTFVS